MSDIESFFDDLFNEAIESHDSKPEAYLAIKIEPVEVK